MDYVQRTLSEIAHLDLKDWIINTQLHAVSFGASCDVYSAWSKKHEKKVAVKRICVFLTKEKAFMKRLAKEIRIWAKLDHENVLPLLGYITEGEHMVPSLISEWMGRGTMQEYMKTIPRCGIETCRMLVGIASGLEYLHSKKIIHTDLNSVCELKAQRNILISIKKTPLLADFGLSLALTRSQTMVGTTTSTRGTVGVVELTTTILELEVRCSRHGGNTRREDSRKAVTTMCPQPPGLQRSLEIMPLMLVGSKFSKKASDGVQNYLCGKNYPGEERSQTAK